MTSVSPKLPPMEAQTVDALPDGPGWQYEPKWDGFRCLVHRNGKRIELRSKSGTLLNRYFPDLVAAVEQTGARRFVLDGEIVVPVNGKMSFSELQLRLHPAASRVAMLANARPAVLMVFDLLLGPDGPPLLDRPLAARREALERFFKSEELGMALRLSPRTTAKAEALRWLKSRRNVLDGIIAKRLDAPYRAGERDAMVKYKRQKTADCVVGGFRYGKDGKQVGSLLLGLYDREGRLNHVGFTSAFSREEKPALTKRLERLIAPPGFTGRAPGAPSRWSTERSAQWQPLKPKLVVEVEFDHVTDCRFRHGTTLLRWRPDKRPTQCRMDQLDQ
ncbi:MAG TPA: ATP-dependent DNA ligase [Alphaproteobacteria bacterium]|nr:ATP-dependent DNA ligase [Alphaproteobacteria bacterium]